MTEAPSISLSNASVLYDGADSPTLREVSCEVNPGEMVLVTGASGCGKTTLLRCLGGFVPRFSPATFSGEWRVHDLKIPDDSVVLHGRDVGMVFQNPDHQLFHSYVWDELVFGLENLGLSREEMGFRAREALRLVRMEGLEEERLDSFSGGQKQRIALASILAMKPKILLLDEPASQLDPQGRLAFREVLGELMQTGLYTVLLVSHRLEEWWSLADRIWLLGQGELLLDASPDLACEHVEIFESCGVRLPWEVELKARGQNVRKKESGEVSEKCEELPFSSDEKPPQKSLFVAESLPCFSAEGTDQADGLRGFSLVALEEAEKWLDERLEQGPRSIQDSIPSMGPPLLGIQDLSFGYTRNSLLFRELSLHIHPGECVALMGANGSGKSTLLHLLAGTLRPRSGEIVLEGRRKRKILPEVGFLLQQPDLSLLCSTVSEELNFFPKNRRVSALQIQERREKVATLLNLVPHLDASPLVLSQGQRQRLALGAIWTGEPSVFLLDEPTSGQDWRHLSESLDWLRREVQRRQGACVFATHNEELAWYYADRVVLISQGSIVANGSPESIFQQQELLRSCALLAPRRFALREQVREERQKRASEGPERRGES